MLRAGDRTDSDGQAVTRARACGALFTCVATIRQIYPPRVRFVHSMFSRTVTVHRVRADGSRHSLIREWHLTWVNKGETRVYLLTVLRCAQNTLAPTCARTRINPLRGCHARTLACAFVAPRIIIIYKITLSHLCKCMRCDANAACSDRCHRSHCFCSAIGTACVRWKSRLVVARDRRCASIRNNNELCIKYYIIFITLWFD